MERHSNHRTLQKLTKSLEYHKTGLELLKLVHKVDQAAIPLRIINSVLKVSGAYLSLYLTAGLIDALLSGHFRQGLYHACAIVASGLLFGLSAGLLEKAYAKSAQRCTLNFAVMMRMISHTKRK